jgi:hypothetical protein
VTKEKFHEVRPIEFVHNASYYWKRIFRLKEIMTALDFYSGPRASGDSTDVTYRRVLVLPGSSDPGVWTLEHLVLATARATCRG